MKPYRTVQRLGERFAQPQMTKPMYSKSWCKTDLLVCDGDLVGLAIGLGFRNDPELYAVMTGFDAQRDIEVQEASVRLFTFKHPIGKRTRTESNPLVVEVLFHDAMDNAEQRL